jgi:hypothetical protein
MIVSDRTFGIVAGLFFVSIGVFATHIRPAKSQDEGAWRALSPGGRAFFIIGGILVIIAGLRAQ